MGTIKRTHCVMLALLLWGTCFSLAQAYTVDGTTIKIASEETVAYSDLSEYDTTYTIDIAEGGTLTHTAWVFNPMTGTGTFRLKPTGGYDNPQQPMQNVSGFTGTVVLDSSSAGIRLRGSAYDQFNPGMTVEVSNNSQLWLNQSLHSNLYLHDAGGMYDSLGLVRFDGSGITIDGDISVSGKVQIAARLDRNTSQNTIAGQILGVHTADDATKDNMLFTGNGSSVYPNTFATVRLTNGNNYWNGTTTINYLTLELAGDGTIGEGSVAISGYVEDAEKAYKSETGTLAINKTDAFTLPNTFSNAGIIRNLGDNETTLTGSLNSFTGTLDVQKGTVVTSGKKNTMTVNIASGATVREKYATVESATEGGIKLTGTGTFIVDSVSTGGDFFVNAYDLSNFDGTFEIQQGRTFNTRAALCGENATIKVDDGASYMFYGGNIAGDYKSKFSIAGSGHSEKRGAIRFHQEMTADLRNNLNTANNIALPNITGDVTLVADSLIIARNVDTTGLGVISGNISGNYLLTLNDAAKGWIALTGTNSYGKTTINSGTTQLGYVGSINGTTYDGTTGTLGTDDVWIQPDGVLDYRRVNEYVFDKKITNHGTINVASGTLTLGTIPEGTGKVTGSGTFQIIADGAPTNPLSNFSEFTGTIKYNGKNEAGNRLMFNGGTVHDFGRNARFIIGDKGQIYMGNATIFGNFEFGGSTGYKGDTNYQAALRSDGSSQNKVYGSITLLDDNATISTRAAGNVAQMTLYANVTGDGSLNKQEDGPQYAGTLYVGTETIDGITYGGTLDYKGATNVKSGNMILQDGVTMYAQDNINLGNTTLTTPTTGTFILEEGATLTVGAKDATTGTALEFTGQGSVELNGTIALDLFSVTDFDTITFAQGLSPAVSDTLEMSVTIAEDAGLGNTLFGLNKLVDFADSTIWDKLGVILPPDYGLIYQNGIPYIGSVSAIPEPATYILLVLGCVGMFWLKRK